MHCCECATIPHGSIIEINPLRGSICNDGVTICQRQLMKSKVFISWLIYCCLCFLEADNSGIVQQKVVDTFLMNNPFDQTPNFYFHQPAAVCFFFHIFSRKSNCKKAAISSTMACHHHLVWILFIFSLCLCVCEEREEVCVKRAILRRWPPTLWLLTSICCVCVSFCVCVCDCVKKVLL